MATRTGMAPRDSRRTVPPGAPPRAARRAADRDASRGARALAEHLHRGGHEHARSVVQRALLEVEELVVVRMHDAARLVPRADEEEAARSALLIGREILAAHGRDGI